MNWDTIVGQAMDRFGILTNRITFTMIIVIAIEFAMILPVANWLGETILPFFFGLISYLIPSRPFWFFSVKGEETRLNLDLLEGVPTIPSRIVLYPLRLLEGRSPMS